MHDGQPETEPDRHTADVEGLEAVTVELEDSVVEAIDDIAFTDHRGNRAAAIRTLLDEWLQERDGKRE